MANLYELLKQAKEKLPLDRLMEAIGHADYNKPSCKSPFRDEAHPSFGTFRTEKGELKWKDFMTGETGDGGDYLARVFTLSDRAAVERYLELAGIEIPMNGTNGNGNGHRKAHKQPCPSRPAPAREEPTPNLKPFDWASCVEAVTPDHVTKIAAWRGYSMAFVEWLKTQSLIGVHQGYVATPVQKDGVYVGCQYRTADGPRYANATPGAKTPAELLVFGQPDANILFTMESQWDGFALMEKLGLHLRSGSDICVAMTRSASNFGKLLPLLDKRAKSKAPDDVILVGQNDKPRPDGKPTGHATLEAGVRKQCADTGLTLKLLFPPAKVKDFNDWIREDCDIDILEFLEAARAKNTSKLAARTFTEIYHAIHAEDDNYFGDRMLAESQPCIMLGAAGTGKSRLLLQFAICCILGWKFLGMDTHAKGRRWLFVQTENSTRRLQADARGLAKGLGLSASEIEILGEYLTIHTLESESDSFVGLDSEEEFSAVQTLITDYNPDFVVLDPLNTFTNGNLDSDADMKAACRLITRAVKRGNPNRVPFIVHHALTGKAGAAKAVGWDKGGFGRNSKALVAWARSAFNLTERDPDDNTKLLLACGKNSNGKPFPPIGIVFNDANYVYEIDPEFNLEDFKAAVSDDNKGRQAVKSRNFGRLLEMIGDESIPKAKLRDTLMTEFKMTSYTAYRFINEARDAGLIESSRVGKCDFCSRKQNIVA